MTLKQDMKVYYETFPESLKYCDWCGKSFRTVAGLRNHAVKMHAAEMDAARDLSVGDRVIYWKPIPGGLLLKQYATITDRRGVRFKLQRDLTKRPVWVKAWSLSKIDKV